MLASAPMSFKLPLSFFNGSFFIKAVRVFQHSLCAYVSSLSRIDVLIQKWAMINTRNREVANRTNELLSLMECVIASVELYPLTCKTAALQ